SLHEAEIALDCEEHGVYKTTGLNQVVALDDPITLYPNPAKEELNIKIATQNPTEDFRILLTDLQGRVISELYEGKEKEVKVFLPQLSAGVYLISIIEPKQAVRNQKLIIKP